MKRGKVIGLIVLIVAIGLVIAGQLGDSGVDTATSEGGDRATARPQTGGVATMPEGVGPAEGEIRVYAIDAARSEVYWRVYRGGAFPALGHSHVISAGQLSGSVSLSNDLATTEWTLSIPVAGLIVDDPELRSRHGEEFESVPSDQDKAGTRTNMLTDRVLNGEVFTEIRLTGTGVNGSLADAALPVSIHLLGRTIEQVLPASVTISADSLTVEGEYGLTHADLGMEPFSAFGGAVAVGEAIDLTYRIHAVAGGQ
jgi:hypothetical protein